MSRDTPAAAPPPALSPYDWRVWKGIPDERSYSGTKIDELLAEYAAHLQAELERRDKVLKEIKTEVTSTEPGSIRDAIERLNKRAEAAAARCRLSSAKRATAALYCSMRSTRACCSSAGSFSAKARMFWTSASAS